MTTTAPNGTAQTTQYRYDGNGNLIEVTEPNIGTTTLTYDGVNRLTERTLPNDIRTVYTYKENTDFIESITHYAADGTTILSSVEYVRNPGGEPSRIIREDGSYVDLQYDDSLRLEKETYYDSNGNLTDETTYTYDAAGNRQSASNGEAQGTYTYDNTHQLAGIDTNSGTETYTYDEGGRVEQVVRDGETLNLFYNSNDLIVKVTDANGNTVVEYGYDSNGRRVEMSDGNGEKNYLVAPNLGEGLDSPHLVSDAAGNPLASYVYAGSMPLMRLDANGNPVYYLEDGMGSVIGLADGTGSQVTGFEYDSFGNLRTPEGLPAELGGDFRFQGQWLESNTDFYHFRARYYDPEVGRFISRDPVDLIETEPESSNPYQFVYNNPLIYSDPTGMFTITKLNSTLDGNKILETIRIETGRAAREYLIDAAKEVVNDVALSALRAYVPFSPDVIWDAVAHIRNDEEKRKQAGIKFGNKASQDINTVFNKDQNFLDYIHLAVPIDHNTGIPQGNGINIRRFNDPEPYSPGYPRPDYLIKFSEPTNQNERSLLVGDFKLSVTTMVNHYRQGGAKHEQWLAIVRHAKHYGVKFAGFLTLYAGTSVQNEQLRRGAVKRGVVAVIVSFKEKKGLRNPVPDNVF